MIATCAPAGRYSSPYRAPGHIPLVITGEQHNVTFTHIYLLLNADKLGGLSAHPAIT